MKFIVALTFLALSASAQSPPECEKKPNAKFSQCCKGMPDLSDFVDDQIIKECNVDNLIGSCEYFDCSFKKVNLSKPNNKIDLKVSSHILEEAFSNDLVSLAKSAADKCIAEIDYSGDCVPGVLMRCFMSDVLKNCPKSSFHAEKEECAELITFTENCPLPPPML